MKPTERDVLRSNAAHALELSERCLKDGANALERNLARSVFALAICVLNLEQQIPESPTSDPDNEAEHALRNIERLTARRNIR